MMSNVIEEILLRAQASTEEALQTFDSMEPVSTEFMHGRWKGSEFHTGHPLDGLFEASGFYGKIFINDEEVHPLVFFGKDSKELYSVNPNLVPFNMKLPKNEWTERMIKMGRFILETKQSKARLRNLEYRGRSSASMIYDDLPIIDTFVKIDENKVLGVMDFKGRPEPFFFILERDDDSAYEIAPLVAREERVKELFEMEVQNRAFALRSSRAMVDKVSKEDEKYFYSTWVTFEEFTKGIYAPVAAKYGFSQEPGLMAKIQAGLGNLGIDILPDSVMYKTMLNQTVNYLEKLIELRDIAPEEDAAFFNFVVLQEEVQIDALKLVVDGKTRAAADLLKAFIEEQSN